MEIVKKTLEEAWEEIVDKIDEIFESVKEEDHPGLVEHIAVSATIAGANNVYEGIGILHVAAKTYEDVCINCPLDDENHEHQIVNMN